MSLRGEVPGGESSVLWGNMLPLTRSSSICLTRQIVQTKFAEVYTGRIIRTYLGYHFPKKEEVIVKAYTLNTDEIYPQGAPRMSPTVRETYDQINDEYLYLKALNARGIKPNVLAYLEPPQNVLARTGRVFIAMENIEGPTLQSTMDHHYHYTIPQAVAIIDDVLQTLQVAHEAAPARKAILNRDIKPANIILSKHRATLIDWNIGLSEIEVPFFTFEKDTTTGTIDYMAPEQILLPNKGNPEGIPIIGKSTDIYQVGIVLWELLTNRSHRNLFLQRVFDEDYVGIFQYITSRGHRHDLQTALEFNSIPQPLIAVVIKAVQGNPDDRFQSAEEMRNALASFTPHTHRR